MRKKHKYTAWAVLAAAVLLVAVWYFSRHYVAVMQPRGTVGRQERDLILIGLLLAVFVVVPVYAMTVAIAWKYRAGNAKARYSPDWDHGRALEFTWWAIPGVIILALSIIAWNSAHALDPYNPISSSQTPLEIQVVSLDWKWLFIYPKQDVASVNFVEFPSGVPVDFNITSDTVMNSFWIPALGGQIYSMPGMTTHLQLIADRAGTYQGSSANISGKGFSGMDFTAKSVPYGQFAGWAAGLRNSSQILDSADYRKLAAPSQDNPVSYYSGVQNGLFNDIIMKYQSPAGQGSL